MKFNKYEIKKSANCIRSLSIDMVEKAKSGHPGMPMGMADVCATLFLNHININYKDTNWANRDRFILSAGHGSVLLYSLFHLSGIKEITIEELKKFRQLGSLTPGHPEHAHTPGVETTTGPLGQGIATSVGIALSKEMLSKRLGSQSIDYKTYVVVSDGDLMEGISQEAISLAGHWKLNDLIVFWDNNNISIDGELDLCSSEDQIKRFQACGWNTIEVCGHDIQKIDDAIKNAKLSDKPTLISCKTIIGYGSPNKQGKSSAHGAPLGVDEIKLVKKALCIDDKEFYVPDDVYKTFKTAMNRGVEKYNIWIEESEKNFNKFKESQFLKKDSLNEIFKNLKNEFAVKKTEKATRQLSGMVLENLIPDFKALIGGSADLTGSNNTKTKSHKDINSNDFSGNYINYGVREHAMAAIANGLSLCDVWIPYVATFLVFSDYLRPALRLSALMKRKVIYVLTHDSIGLGEDGPTHQPIEHLSSLMSVPGVQVLRPADPIEVVECYEKALFYNGPTILALTRQKVTPFRTESNSYDLDRGGYSIYPTNKNETICLISSGSEVEIAINVKNKLEENGVNARVLSVPDIKTFLKKENKEYRENLLKGCRVIAIEASNGMHWMGICDEFIGLDDFGASAPIKDLYDHFGLNAEKITDKIMLHQR